MKNTTAKTKMNVIKTLFAAMLMIGSVTAVFHGLTQFAMAAENRQITALPTAYPASISAPVQSKQTKAPDGYVKPNYILKDNSLEFYRNNKPTANDISRERAAEIGVQALWSVFGLDLNNKTIEMGYEPAKEILRAKWLGEYWADGKKGPEHPLYLFTIDAVTGEVYSVYYTRILDKKVDLSYDATLAKNPAVMEKVAKKFAEDLNITGGAVKTATIASQGYSVNDPTATFRIVGENGQLAIIGLSRYDKALLSVNYHSSVVEMDAQAARIEQGIAATDAR